MKKISTKVKTQEKNKMSEIDDQILKYFDIKKRLGKGAYGVVWKAIDRKTNNIVAVKKIFDAFRNETDAQRTFREIMFLRAFRSHPNVIQLFSIHKATNNLDIYLAFEFMESDLHNVIKRGTILKDIHKRYVMYQLFNAVKYIHSGNVIHRDLKPSNVLIDSKCRCKIADFGLARSVSNRPTGNNNTSVDPTEPILTDYVATRWYRAPEILIASKKYTKGIDMWSLGCILGEMIRGKPLFPGSSTVNQIEKIIASLPEVTDKDVAAIGSGFGTVLLNQQINLNGNPSLEDLLTGAPDDAKQLVKGLLVLDPNSRLTAKEALSHKYIEKFRHSISEAELNTDVLPPFRDDVQLTVPEYRSKLYEIMYQTAEKDQVTTLKLNHSAKQYSIRKKEITPTNIRKTQSINSAVSINKRISPLKSDDKLKREYQYLKYTDMKQQQTNNTTSQYQHHQSLPQNNNSINTNQNNNNQNNNGSYQNNNNNNIPSSSSSSSTSNKTAGHYQQNLHNIKSTNNNNTCKINNQQNLNNNNDNIKQSIIGSKLKYCKISTILPSDNNKYTNLINTEILTDNQKIISNNSNYQNKITNRTNIIEKRHSIDCTFTNNNNINSQQHGSQDQAPQSSSASVLHTNQHYNISSSATKPNINCNHSSLNQISNRNNNNGNNIKYQYKNNSNKQQQNNHNDELLLLSSSSPPTTTKIISTTTTANQNYNKYNNNSRKNSLSPPKDGELVNRFKLKKIDVLQMLPSNNTNDQTNYYEKRLKNLEDKINKHKMDIKEFFQDNQKLQNFKPTTTSTTSDNNNIIKLNKIPINNVQQNNNIISPTTLVIPPPPSSQNDNKFLRNKISFIREKFENNNYINNNNNNHTKLLTNQSTKQHQQQVSLFNTKYHSYPGDGDGHILINGKRKEYSLVGATKPHLDMRKTNVIS